MTPALWMLAGACVAIVALSFGWRDDTLERAWDAELEAAELEDTLAMREHQ